MPNHNFIDMTGKQVSFLTVLGYAGTSYNGALWRCLCVCGTEFVTRGNVLRRKNVTGVRSCGCKNPGSTSHGLCYTKQYHMWEAAKARAKEKGLEFNIELADISIPGVCPVLGIELKTNSITKPDSPTLDRIDSSKGYVKGNVRVISHRANTLKSNATVEELSKVLEDAIKCEGDRTGSAT